MVLNYIDLFAGGLSGGFKRAGFNPIDHVEMNNHTCNAIKQKHTTATILVDAYPAKAL